MKEKILRDPTSLRPLKRANAQRQKADGGAGGGGRGMGVAASWGGGSVWEDEEILEMTAVVATAV